MKLQMITLYRDYGMQLLQGAGAQATGGIISEGLGLLTQPLKNKQQLKQARRLQDLSLEGEATRLQRNKQYALEMWNETGYGAQVKQMKEAGINPALLYGMSGGGGQTANVPTAATTQGHAETAKGTHGSEGMGLMLGQMGLMKAQERNLNADSLNKEIDAKNKDTGGIVHENISTNTENIKQEIEFKGKTMQDRVDQANTEALHAIEKLNREQEALKLDRATRLQKAELIRAQVAGQWLANELTKASTKETKAKTTNINQDTEKKKAEIAKMGEEIAMGWQALSRQEKEMKMKALMDKLQITKPTGTMGAGPVSVPWYYHDKESFIEAMDKITESKEK